MTTEVPAPAAIANDASSEAPTASAPRPRMRWPELALRGAFVLAFAYVCRELLLPVALGGIFAVVLSPLHSRLGRSLGRASRAAPALVTLGVLVVVVTPITWMTWEAVVAANELLASGAIGRAGDFGERSFRELAAWVGIDAGDDAAVSEAVTGLFGRVSNAAGSVVAGELRALPTYMTELFLITLSFYYYLRDGGSLLAWLRRISPTGPRESEQLLYGMRHAIHGTVLGMFVVGLAQGGVCLIALLALRIPGAFLWGGVAAICSVLPVVGTAPVTVGAMIYLFAAGRPGGALAMLAVALFIAAIDNVIRPWVQSSHARTHPLLELLAIFGGLAALGPSGLFVGPVLAAMALWAIDGASRRPSGDPAIG
jgi:predicted PurR-regulated permease PerM